MLRPQDVMAVGWIAMQRQPWRYVDMAKALQLSASESHAAVQRLMAAGILLPGEPARAGQARAGDALVGPPRLQRAAAKSFILEGAPYVFYPERGPVTRGVPTGAGGPPLNKEISQSDEMPVWPHPEGQARGHELKPIYKSAPEAALKNKKLHEFLALFDALRDGRAREKKLARKNLEQMLSGE